MDSADIEVSYKVKLRGVFITYFVDVVLLKQEQKEIDYMSMPLQLLLLKCIKKTEDRLKLQ